MVDKPKCDQMLNNLRRYVAELSELAACERQQFLANKDKVGNAKYHFVIAIECCIDIANHIISSENFRFPKSNADSFKILIEKAILDRGMSETYAAMARFRNRLVRLYWDVGDEQIYEFLQSAIADLKTFLATVASFVAE